MVNFQNSSRVPKKKLREKWKHKSTNVETGTWNMPGIRQEGHVMLEGKQNTRYVRHKSIQDTDTGSTKARRTRSTGGTWARTARDTRDTTAHRVRNTLSVRARRARKLADLSKLLAECKNQLRFIKTWNCERTGIICWKISLKKFFEFGMSLR